MNSSLPTDPYTTLGVAKDALIQEIRSAHRKLVLKCHPDKIQDPALKAIKQDEFQKVQQAYELLSDDSKRAKYDESVLLAERRNELRREMARGGGGPPPGPPPGMTVFDYEVRTAEPRSTTFKSSSRDPTNIYSRPPPRSFEDDLGSRMYDEPPRATARKSTSYEDRKRSMTKDDEKRKKAEEDRERERWEKDAKRSAHNSAKKSRDKERKKGSEEKHHRTAFVEDDDSEEISYRSSKPERKSSRKSEEEMRKRGEQARAAEKLRDEALTERTRKLNIHEDFATQYQQAARSKAKPEDDFRPKPMRRSATLHEPSYAARYVVPPSPFVSVDDDYPRRSSAHTARRGSQDLRREPSSPRDRGFSGMYGPEPVIVDAAPPPSMKPTLQTRSSAPPIIQEPFRKEHTRSKTMQSPASGSPPTPSLPRASTFQAGDKPKSKPKSRGSKLKTSVQYATDGSDSEGPVYSPRSPSPPPRRREPESVRYKIDNGRSVPLPRHRAALREDNYDDRRDRSESPGGPRRSFERPPIVQRSSGSSSRPTSSRTPTYFPRSTSPEPIITNARPKLVHRDSYGRSGSNPYFGEVRYAQNYGPENISYSPDGHYRRGSEPTLHRDYAYPSPRPSREAAYA